MKTRHWMMGMLLVASMGSAGAAVAAALKNDAPIEIHSDTLDVLQNDNKAIFKGNVIATQGTTNMRAAEMVVFYRNNDEKKPVKTTAIDAVSAPSSATPQGIYRIEAQGSVIFTTPEETALGDKAIYDVDANTIDLFGGNVTLTRGQNVLKGTRLNHNMATSRSVLTGGAATQAGKPARVHGLFVPKSDKPGAGK
jgi:lipopolysaccharide export system protein LptA